MLTNLSPVVLANHAQQTGQMLLVIIQIWGLVA
jgi:hypothetical protein